MTVPVATCLNCTEPITGPVAEFTDLPGRCFCMPCLRELGAVIAHTLAKTAPDDCWMTDPETGTFVTGCNPTDTAVDITDLAQLPEVDR